MRVQGLEKKTGYFWIVDKPENKVPGEITVEDGGKISLEVLGNFDTDIRSSFSTDVQIYRIVGVIEEEGAVTLEECFYLRKTIALSGAPTRSRLRAGKLLCGAQYEPNEDIKFNTINFRVEGLDEWLGVTGIRVEHYPEGRTASIHYERQSRIQLAKIPGYEFFVEFGYTLPGGLRLTKAEINHHAYLVIQAEQAQSLSEFTALIFKFTNFLGFAMDAQVSAFDLIGFNDKFIERIGDIETRIPVKVFLPLLPIFDAIPKIDRSSMLFGFSSMRENSQSIIAQWFEAYDRLLPAFSLYFSVTQGVQRFADTKFLALAQGLETYHRRTSDEVVMDEGLFESLRAEIIDFCPPERRDWLKGRLHFANEISLAKRIEGIFKNNSEHLGDKKQQSKLVRQIVDTRNYLTHYSEDLISKAAQGIDLARLAIKMEAIFALALMRHIGFSPQEITRILNNHPNLRSRLSSGS